MSLGREVLEHLIINIPESFDESLLQLSLPNIQRELWIAQLETMDCDTCTCEDTCSSLLEVFGFCISCNRAFGKSELVWHDDISEYLCNKCESTYDGI